MDQLMLMFIRNLFYDLRTPNSLRIVHPVLAAVWVPSGGRSGFNALRLVRDLSLTAAPVLHLPGIDIIPVPSPATTPRRPPNAG